MNECFLCGRNGSSDRLEVHHIFQAANRKKSEKYKLVVMLCGNRCHRGKTGVHQNAKLMQKLHEYGQRLFMEKQGATKEEFMKLFGKNYLDEG